MGRSCCTAGGRRHIFIFFLILFGDIQPRYGHPDQVPYRVVWRNLVEDPPHWVKAFLPRQVKILAVTRSEEAGPGDTVQAGPSRREHRRRHFPAPPYALYQWMHLHASPDLAGQVAGPMPDHGGGLAQGTRSQGEELQNQELLSSPLEPSDQSTQRVIRHISTGPLPPVISTAGRHRMPPSLIIPES